MGRSTVEREGVSVAHAARFVLVGTMNPEEGELRPQLLDRFGLTVEVAAPRDPALRAEVVRRRMAFDARPRRASWRVRRRRAGAAGADRRRSRAARPVALGDDPLTQDRRGVRRVRGRRDARRHRHRPGRRRPRGLARPDRRSTRADIRAAARLALPHRRRRNPFDAPGLDEDLLDQLLGDDEPEPDPPGAGPPTRRTRLRATTPASDSDEPTSAEPTAGAQRSGDVRAPARAEPADRQRPATRESVRHGRRGRTGPGCSPRPGVGAGEAGRRSRAITSTGRRSARVRRAASTARCTSTATIRAAAPQQPARGRERTSGSVLDRGRPAASRSREGRESNLVLLCVDASGSMAARRRMEAVKAAALSLLLDAYQRRDKVGLITFRGAGATLALPPTSSVDVAARRLADLPSGGRTPLAEGLLCAAETLRLERIRDPRRRPLLVVVTDGRATPGPDAVARSRRGRRQLRRTGVASLVIDCETGRFRLGLAARLADVHLGAEHVPVGEVGRRSALHRPRRASGRQGGLMPEGQPDQRTRRRTDHPAAPQPAAADVHTGDGKGKSTAAFGLALRGWNQGWSIGVFQFVKSAKWRIGEQTALETLGRGARADRRGRPGRVAQDGLGLVLVAQGRHRGRPRRRGRRGLGGDQAPARRRDPPAVRAGRVHLPDELGLGRRRRRRRHADRAARATST